MTNDPGFWQFEGDWYVDGLCMNSEQAAKEMLRLRKQRDSATLALIALWGGLQADKRWMAKHGGGYIAEMVKRALEEGR